MTARISANVAERRFFMTLLALFAGLAAVLAVTGVYGVMSFVVSQNRPEIGIRLALGARPAQVQRGLLAQAARVVIAGALAGLAAAWWSTQLIETQLFHTSAHDPATLAVVTAALIVVATAACWIPARRTAAIDPAAVLRTE